MEARLLRAAFLAAVVASLGAGYRTTNFVVEAPTSELAEKIGRAAEQYRRELANDWLGTTLPNWPQPCPIHAQVAPNLGAGGATSFMFDHGTVFGWQMNIQGSEERILDSVLPHEVTHTVFASYFLRPLPRWADEGACTTVEHMSERSKQEHMLIDFLRTGRGIAFSQMFVMTEYPQDILPLYAQGYALARFLIDQKGKHEFLAYVKDGMASDDWAAATDKHYGYKNLAVLQNTWLDWVKRGSPLRNPAPGAAELIAAPPSRRPAGSNIVVRAQAADHDSAKMVPVHNSDTPIRLADAAATPIGGARNAYATAPPIRNGSIVIDRGESIVAMAANPPPPPIAIAANGGNPYASHGAIAPRGDDGSWRTADQSAANTDDPPAPPSKSVYGTGFGFIRHAADMAQTPADASGPQSDDAPQGPPVRDAQRQVILEWRRQ